MLKVNDSRLDTVLQVRRVRGLSLHFLIQSKVQHAAIQSKPGCYLEESFHPLCQFGGKLGTCNMLRSLPRTQRSNL